MIKLPVYLTSGALTWSCSRSWSWAKPGSGFWIRSRSRSGFNFSSRSKSGVGFWWGCASGAGPCSRSGSASQEGS